MNQNAAYFGTTMYTTLHSGKSGSLSPHFVNEVDDVRQRIGSIGQENDEHDEDRPPQPRGPLLFAEKPQRQGQRHQRQEQIPSQMKMRVTRQPNPNRP